MYNCFNSIKWLAGLSWSRWFRSRFKLVGHPWPDARARNSSKTIKPDLSGDKLTMCDFSKELCMILFVQKDTFVQLSSSVCLASQSGSHIWGLQSDRLMYRLHQKWFKMFFASLQITHSLCNSICLSSCPSLSAETPASCWLFDSLVFFDDILKPPRQAVNSHEAHL